MYNTLLLLLPLLLSASTVTAQGASCSSSQKCPSTEPCCSEFGFCGSGSYCLGGCDPLASYALDSCQPSPICKNSNMTFTDSSRIFGNASNYDGNATAYDWTLDKGNITTTNGELGMILTESNGGTRLSSTRYLHYGTVTAKVKTGRWAGVVTAFITMSSIKDEIDWEFPGANTTQGQTNYFWQGVIANPTHGSTANGVSDTYNNYHEYTIDWQPDALTFLIDGNNVRTVKASDTQNNSVTQYPNTPSRIQLSIWPAGINGSAPGVVQWAGGMINWNDPDYQSAGYFAAYVSSIDIQCSDPSPPSSNDTSYVYGTNSSSSTPQISFSTASTALKGGAATGSSSSSGIGLKAGIAVGGVMALIIAALAVRACVRKMGKRKRGLKPLDGLGLGLGQPSYQPLHAPTGNPSVESHNMPSWGRRY